MEDHGVKRWQIVVIVFLAMLNGLITRDISRAEGARPILIGALNASWGPTPQVVGLRDGLVALGYRENEQFVIGVRFTQGDLTALPATAQKLVQDGVDIIFADHTPATKAAQQATTQIPIVCAAVGDPVGSGLIQSFAHPGGNITGVADLQLELGPKRLEIFREMIPQLTRALFLYHAIDGYAVSEARELRTAARHLEIVLVERAVRTQEEAQAIITAIQPGHPDHVRGCILGRTWRFRQLWAGLIRLWPDGSTSGRQNYQRGEPGGAPGGG
jgi:putative ABC transport system substrate-binding protein